MKLPVHIILSVTGMLAYGLAAILASLVHLAYTGMDMSILPYMAAIAVMLGWDGHTIAADRCHVVCLRQGLTGMAALLILAFPGLIGLG